MLIQLEIPVAFELRMQQDADRAGMDVPTFVTRRLLESYEEAMQAEAEGTLYDRLKPYIGLIPAEGYPPTSARNAGEQFTDYLVEKKREGRL